MSDLQIGLILLGVILILAVLVFNWWQDRRIRQRMHAHFPEREQDPLMGTQDGGSAGRREPGLGTAALAAQADAAPAEDDAMEVDAAIEAVIDVSFARPVAAEALHAALDSLDRDGAKPVQVFAITDQGGHHARLRAGAHYGSVQLAVLMANRSGALTDVEWSRLWTFAQGLAQGFDGHVEGPELAEVMQRAAALDAVFAGLDAQVGLVIALSAPQDAQTVVAIMAAQGFRPQGALLGWPSEHGIPSFTVLLDGHVPGQGGQGPVSRLDFVLDLPNSPADAHAFSHMADVARVLAAELDGVVLDDQGQPLHDHADAALDQQLHERYQRLEQAGYPAGQPRSARVFS